MSFSQEDCEIFLKPSTELIPDEYPQDNNENACVHIFIFKDHMEKKFADCMQSLGYTIRDENIHPLSSRYEVLSSLQKICDNAMDKCSLIILFWGLFRTDRKFLLKDGSSIKLIDIWSKFISSNCPELREKPKIFIFNAFLAELYDVILNNKSVFMGRVYVNSSFQGVKHLENTEEDTLPTSRKHSDVFSYNIPAEADFLIVFKRNDDLKSSFEYMESLCSNFRNYAYREDINSLLAIAHFSSQPTLISTMTKKIYLQPSQKRGIQLTIREKYLKIEQAIEKMKENIIQLTKDKKQITKPTPETTEIHDTEDRLKRASSIEGNIHRKNIRSELLHTRTRSNTTSKLNDIENILHRRRGSADQKPAWRY